VEINTCIMAHYCLRVHMGRNISILEFKWILVVSTDT